MSKHIKVLEVPFYLLVIALFCLETENPEIAVFLLIISIGRLITNTITDEITYKK